MALTAQEILNLQDSDAELVKIPEWNESIHIRSVTGYEREQLLKILEDIELVSEKATPSSFMARVAALVISDENGNRIFKDDDYKELEKKNGQALQRIMLAGLKQNALDNASVEELEKN